MKKILGIIPARFESTRLPGKPLVDLAGKSMIQHVYEQAKKSLEHVIVATDDQRIFDTVKDFGGNVVMTKKGHSTGSNRCLEAYQSLEQKESFDIIINIQGDEPLLNPLHITDLISCFEIDSTNMATLVTKVRSTKDLLAGGVFVVFSKAMQALYFSRAIIPTVRDAQQEDWINHHTYYKHIGMYGFTPKALEDFSLLKKSTLEEAESLEQNRWLENDKNIRIAITEKEGISVDTEEDVIKAIKAIEKNESK